MTNEKFTLEPKDTVKQIAISCYRSKEDVEQFCLNFCEHYAFIVHDSDVTDDGTPKEPHIHLLATFHNRTQVSVIVRRLLHFGDTTTNTTVLYKKMMNKATAFDYLTHKNAPKKFQYNEQDVVTDDASYWRKTEMQLQEEANDQFLCDLLNEKPLTMARRYGRDYIKNFSKYNDFRYMILEQQYREAEAQEMHEMGIERSDNVTETRVHPLDKLYNYDSKY